MNLEDIVYPIFGTSMVVGRHIKRQLNVLDEMLPPEYRGLPPMTSAAATERSP